MPDQPEYLIDGYLSLEGGMNSGISPSLLQQNQCALSVNTTNRGAFIRTRPRFQRIKITPNGTDEMFQWFKDYPISGKTYYKTARGDEYILCCAGGRIFQFSVDNNYSAEIREVTPENRNTMYAKHTYFQQALQYMVIQNGTDTPIVYDGVNATRTNGAIPQVPTGRQMAYINNRLFVVDPNGSTIYPGDLGNMTATSVVEFTEVSQPAAQGGMPLQMPISMGEITAIIATAQLDTQAGQGNLLCCSNNAITSLNPITQRSQWPNIQLQNVALVGNGFTSDGLAIVNGDVWGRSTDGIRSYLMARREFGQWGNTPQSREVDLVISNDDKGLLSYADCVYFDNRLLITATPQPITNGCYHMGIIALNFDNISNIQGKSSPAYDGIWTGIMPYGFVIGEFRNRQRCFAFCRDENGNYLTEITTEYGDDDSYFEGETKKISCRLETKSFGFNKASLPKSICNASLWMDELAGEVDFNLRYRPDQQTCWQEWNKWKECSIVANCTNDCPPSVPSKQYRTNIQMGEPDQVEDLIMQHPYNYGNEFQIRLDWIGNVRIRAIRVGTNTMPVTSEVTTGDLGQLERGCQMQDSCCDPLYPNIIPPNPPDQGVTPLPPPPPDPPTPPAVDPPKAPVLVGTMPSDSEVYLAWAAVPLADGYRVFKSTDGINYNMVSAQNGTSYSDTSVVPHAQYSYYVIAYNTAGDSPKSNITTFSSSVTLTKYIHLDFNFGDLTSPSPEIAIFTYNQNGTQSVYYSPDAIPVGGIDCYIPEDPNSMAISISISNNDDSGLNMPAWQVVASLTGNSTVSSINGKVLAQSAQSVATTSLVDANGEVYTASVGSGTTIDETAFANIPATTSTITFSADPLSVIGTQTSVELYLQ